MLRSFTIRERLDKYLEKDKPYKCFEGYLSEVTRKGHLIPGKLFFFRTNFQEEYFEEIRSIKQVISTGESIYPLRGPESLP